MHLLCNNANEKKRYNFLTIKIWNKVLRKSMNFSISWNLTHTLLEDLWVKQKLLVQYHSVAWVALKILISESANEKSMACKGQSIWWHDCDVFSVPTGHRPMKPSVLAHSSVRCCSTAQEIHCKPPPWFCLYVYISRLETYKLSHEHRGWGVSPSELSVWHFKAAGWLQSDTQAYTWSIWGDRTHISETATGISGPGQLLLGEENRLQFQAECLNSSILAYGDFYFLYLYNPNNLFPRLVLLLYVTSGLNILKHSLFSVISLWKWNKPTGFALGTLSSKEQSNFRFITM